MAKQRNQYFIGRKDHLVYYMWKGGFYIRTRSTLSGKRFWKDPAFAASRKRAVEFGTAAKLAGEIYPLLPVQLKKRGMMGTLTGQVHKELLSGKPKEVVKQELLVAYGLVPKEIRTNQQAIDNLPSLLLLGKRYSLTESRKPSAWQVNAQGNLLHKPESETDRPGG